MISLKRNSKNSNIPLKTCFYITKIYFLSNTNTYLYLNFYLDEKTLFYR